MSQNCWKWREFLLNFNCVNYIYVWAFALVLITSIAGNNIPSHRCVSKLADGSLYTHSCHNKTENVISSTPEESKLGSSSTTNPTQKEQFADSEVADLNKHNSKYTVESVEYTSTKKTDIKGNKESATPNNSEKIDAIVKPNYASSSKNSRFNITAGGIIILLCFTVTVVFYAGIMLWKKMKGYENREILLNDDDIADINDEDMRHFELKFLDRDGRVIESANRR